MVSSWESGSPANGIFLDGLRDGEQWGGRDDREQYTAQFLTLRYA